MTYSLDFRKKVLSIKAKESLSFARVSKRFGLSINTVFLWSKNIIPQANRNKQASKIDMSALKQDVEEFPDAYLYERAHRLRVSKNGIWWALKRLKVTYKKNTQSSQSMSRRTTYLPNQD